MTAAADVVVDYQGREVRNITQVKDPRNVPQPKVRSKRNKKVLPVDERRVEMSQSQDDEEDVVQIV